MMSVPECRYIYIYTSALRYGLVITIRRTAVRETVVSRHHIEAKLTPTMKPLEHHSNTVKRGLGGALNYAEIRYPIRWLMYK